MAIERLVNYVGDGLELGGVVVIVAGVAGSLASYLFRWAIRREADQLYHRARQAIGRSILLGLELLVAGDIIRTVALSPTFSSVGVLAGIVLIRTFLSFTLELEITGRWPWQSN